MAPLSGILKKGIGLIDNIANMSTEVKTVAQEVKASESVFTMPVKEQDKAIRIMSKVSNVNNKNMLARLRSSNPKMNALNSLTIKTYVESLKGQGIPKEALEELSKAKTTGELQAAIFNFRQKLNECVIAPIVKQMPHKNSKAIPLEIEQMVYEATNKCNEARRNLYRLFAVPSRDNAVIEIETALRKNYNLTARLGNDLPKATNIYKGIVEAASKGLKLPDEIIVTHYIQGGEHLCWRDGSMHTIIIGSTKMKSFLKSCPKARMSESVQNLINEWLTKTGFKRWFSTDSSEHMILHEIWHQEHLPLLAFKHKSIPKSYRPVINQLSGYAASKPTSAHEVYTELNVKRTLSELTQDEMALFKFLGGEV